MPLIQSEELEYDWVTLSKSFGAFSEFFCKLVCMLDCSGIISVDLERSCEFRAKD